MRDPKKKELKTSTKFFSFIYFIIIVIAAYYLSGLAVEQLDTNGTLDIKIPKVNKPVPPWVIQFVIGALIFMVLQFLLVFIFGLLKGREKNVYKYEPPKDQWRR